VEPNWNGGKIMGKPTIQRAVVKAKTLHGLTSQQREFCNNGEHINTDDLRTLKNICFDIIQMAEEIEQTQRERYDG
jgi:response regulator RpfG family c-di-GMP phosphodiesterase